MCDEPPAVAVSVVIPTRDRPELLRRCLEAIATGTEASYEVVVVNDGGGEVVLPSDVSGRVVESGGNGPAHARNCGIRSARGDIVVFTDDDTIPHPGWIDVAVGVLSCSPTLVGVEGPVECRDFDALYEHSVRNRVGGAHLTCNIAYRRAALEQVGGFDESFPAPHCEDRDLGARVQRIGAIGFVETMSVEHPPRPIGWLDLARRARLLESEWLLYRKHPGMAPPRWSVRWAPLMRIARRWQRLAVTPGVLRRSPRRWVRFVSLAAAQLGIGLAVTLTRWRNFERVAPT